MFGRRNCCNRQNMGFGYGNQGMNSITEGQVIEPTITKCVEEECYHEVPHICPIHTHVIKRDIYNHTYTPQYSCSQENQVVNNDCGGCSGFAR